MRSRVSLAAFLAAALVAIAVPSLSAGFEVSSGRPGSPPLPTDDLMLRGLSAFHKGDYAAARRDFRLLAQRDVPAAETLLGTMSANGQGGPPDHAVAAAWFLRAARRGYGPAQLALADAFAQGRGVPQNVGRANDLARAAAGQGQPGAAQLAARLGPQRYAQAAITGGRP